MNKSFAVGDTVEYCAGKAPTPLTPWRVKGTVWQVRSVNKLRSVEHVMGLEGFESDGLVQSYFRLVPVSLENE